MFKLNVIKAAAVIVMGEAIAHYEVLPTGALMFGDRNAYEQGKFLVVGKDKAYFTNPFGDGPDNDVTEDFNFVMEHLREADAAEGEQAVMLLGKLAVTIGNAEFVGGNEAVSTEYAMVGIIAEKLIPEYGWEKVSGLIDDCYGIGEDSVLPHNHAQEDVESVVNTFYFGF